MLRTFATLLATVVLTTLCLVQPAPAGAAVEKDWGWTKGQGAVLKKGCRRYSYRYELTLPSNDWDVEVFVIDPRGRQIASDYLLSDSEPAKGRRWFEICRVTTVPGTFKIRSKVTTHDGWDETRGRLPKSTFRLRRG